MTSPQQQQTSKITTTDPISTDNFQNDEDPNNLNHDTAHDVENPPRVITIVPPAATNSNNKNSPNKNNNNTSNNNTNNNTAEDEVSELDETLTQYTYSTYVTKRCCSTRALTLIVLLTALLIFLSRGPAFGLSSSSSSSQNGVSGAGVSAASSSGGNSGNGGSSNGGNVSSAKPTQVVEEKEKDKKQEAKSGKQR